MNIKVKKRDHVSRAKPHVQIKRCASLSYDRVFIVKLLMEWSLQEPGDPKYKQNSHVLISTSENFSAILTNITKGKKKCVLLCDQACSRLKLAFPLRDCLIKFLIFTIIILDKYFKYISSIMCFKIL